MAGGDAALPPAFVQRLASVALRSGNSELAAAVLRRPELTAAEAVAAWEALPDKSPELTAAVLSHPALPRQSAQRILESAAEETIWWVARSSGATTTHQLLLERGRNDALLLVALGGSTAASDEIRAEAILQVDASLSATWMHGDGARIRGELRRVLSAVSTGIADVVASRARSRYTLEGLARHAMSPEVTDRLIAELVEKPLADASAGSIVQWDPIRGAVRATESLALHADPHRQARLRAAWSGIDVTPEQREALDDALVPHSAQDMKDQTWVAVRKAATRYDSFAAALAGELTEALGCDPDKWKTFESLSGEFSGTVGQLLATVTAVTQPPERPDEAA
jgi:hypothetical protein